MMPCPTHLKACLRLPEEAVSEDAGALTAPVVCPCGGAALELLYPGEWELERGRPVIKVKKIGKAWFLRLEARCVSCGRSHLLLDDHLHGWNGLVCHEKELAALPRPNLIPWVCPTCGKNRHGVTVQLCCPGKDFVMEESEGEVDESRWADAFSGFAVSVTCGGCGGRIEQLVDYETM